jgi:hypothetical protein
MGRGRRADHLLISGTFVQILDTPEEIGGAAQPEIPWSAVVAGNVPGKESIATTQT